MFNAQRERGTTLVLVTHDPGLAERCDRMIRVRSGEIEETQTDALGEQQEVSA